MLMLFLAPVSWVLLVLPLLSLFFLTLKKKGVKKTQRAQRRKGDAKMKRRKKVNFCCVCVARIACKSGCVSIRVIPIKQRAALPCGFGWFPLISPPTFLFLRGATGIVICGGRWDSSLLLGHLLLLPFLFPCLFLSLLRFVMRGVRLIPFYLLLIFFFICFRTPSQGVRGGRAGPSGTWRLRSVSWSHGCKGKKKKKAREVNKIRTNNVTMSMIVKERMRE